jgi:LPS export ABC transporter protein LptC
MRIQHSKLDIQNLNFRALTAIILSLGLAVFFASGCMNRSPEHRTLPDSTMELPEQEIWNSTIIMSRDGATTSIIHAGHIARYKQKTETLLDSGVTVDFYDKQGRHTSVLTSNEGMVKGEENDLSAWGNVVIVSDSGQVLRTEAIRWDAATEKIVSDTFVTITSALDTLYGIGLVSDAQLENWEIKKPTGKTYRELDLNRQRKRQINTIGTDTMKVPSNHDTVDVN